MTPSFVRRRFVIPLVAACVAFAAVATAQETRGRITGRVTDPSGSAVPGASVEIKDAARGSTLAASPAVAGEAVTTSSTGAFASAAAWLRSWATVALAAVAVSTFGPSGPTTKAP